MFAGVAIGVRNAAAEATTTLISTGLAETPRSSAATTADGIDEQAREVIGRPRLPDRHRDGDHARDQHDRRPGDRAVGLLGREDAGEHDRHRRERARDGGATSSPWRCTASTTRSPLGVTIPGKHPRADERRARKVIVASLTLRNCAA
jgi:hypothetical protein